jgi:hypothetical protein
MRICKIDFKDLREYTIKYGYGKPMPISIGEYKINLIPMAHPRQIGGLGRSNQFWFDEHKKWEQQA